MDLRSSFESSPFMKLLGIELLDIGDGRATGGVEFTDDLAAVDSGGFIQGGLIFTLADAIAGVAIATRTGQRSVTIDMRIDYLAPATSDLFAEAVVQRIGDTVAVVDVEVTTPDDTLVATVRGAFRTETGYEFDQTHDVDA